MEIIIPIKRFVPCLLSMRLPKKGETFLWEVTDNDFTYTSLFSIHIVTGGEVLDFGIQLIVGPLLVSIAFPKL